MHETIHRYLKKKNEKGNEEREREETSMKKFKKLLVGLLAGAMMLGSMSATAFAADATTTTKMPTIDENRTGSLTIHKYEYNGTDTANKGTGSETDTANKGTGSETDTANKGTGSETDTANKATGSETDIVPEGAKPLAGAGFTLYKVADVKNLTNYYSKNPTDLPNVDNYVTDGKIKKDYSGTKARTEVTDADGLATFTDLDLGFYVVIETTTPDKVTTPVTPFLVSIPMTTAKGDNWLYDVHVYPKNKTTYGGVTLEKKGNNNTPLSGVKFVLQKKNTAENKWDNVTINESTNTSLGELITDEKGKITVDGLSQGTYRFIETDRGDNDGYIMDGVKTYEFVVGSDGKITYDGKENNSTITVINEKPDMTKQVKDRTSGDWKQETDYNVGDMVPYQITVDVPSNITKLKEFTLTDTPTHLKDDIKKVVVKCGERTLTKGAEYTIEQKESENGFKITFDTSKMENCAGGQLVITYNAKLLSSAVTTTVGNTNSAKLEYSNKILPGQDDPDKDYIENTTTVYTFKLQVLKKAESEDGDPLENVEFDLYKEVPAGTANAIPEDAAKAAGLDSAKTWLKINTESLKTDANGEVFQKGLANGTYYLVETKTVAGYNLLKAPVKVELNIEYKTNGTHTETIINKTGFTLPTTGGMGTIAITALGVALAFAGVLIIGASRKKTVK